MSEQEPRDTRPRHPMDEKDEEKHEKDVDKHEEKQDQNWEEKWRRDPINAATWALILIWAGFAFLLGNWGAWGAFSPLQTWDIVLLGAGGLFYIQVVVRLLVPEYRQPILGTLILATVLVGVALGDTVGWGIIWPIILIFVGLAVLLRGITNRR